MVGDATQSTLSIHPTVNTMQKLLPRKSLAAVMALLVVGFLGMSAASAQEADTIDVKDDRVVIEIEDGKIYVNGEAVGDEENPFVIRFRDGRDVSVFMPGQRGFFHRRGGGPRGMVWVGPDGDEAEIFGRDFTVRVPRIEADVLRERHIAPMIERLRDHDFTFEFNPEFEHEMEALGNHVWIYGDDELREMEREAHALARDARRAEGAERDRLEGELQDKLEAIFDYKMEKRAEQIDELREEMEEQRARIEERRQAREDIIERRKRQLLGERDIFVW